MCEVVESMETSSDQAKFDTQLNAYHVNTVTPMAYYGYQYCIVKRPAHVHVNSRDVSGIVPIFYVFSFIPMSGKVSPKAMILMEIWLLECTIFIGKKS